jgi:hypothetical protein
MNKLILLVTLLLSISPLGFGTAIPACDKDTLTDYIADGGSCAVGDVVFSSFSYSSPGSVPVSSSIRVLPTIVSGEFGLRFRGPWWAGGKRTKESVIGYTVEGAPGFALDDAVLEMAKFGIKGPGSVSVVESAKEKSGVLFVGDSSSGVASSDSVAFPGIPKLTISDDITVAGNWKAKLGHANAQVLEVANLYSVQAVAEPASMVLFGSGLLGVLGAARRKP